MENKRYYFDWAASSFGNPSSLHSEGRAAKQALEDSRERCAAVLGVPANTLFFTSGGTESNAISIFSNLVRVGNNRTISSAAEHASVREAMETLEKMGKPTGVIPVDPAGRVTPELLAKTLAQYNNIRFASIMAVNNETGTVTDIPALRDIIKKHCTQNNLPPIHFHCDIVQAVGKVPVDISGWDIDSASISAHKIGGPRGIGLLYLKRGGKTEVFYKGGGQENNIRGGTENIQGALALADCMEKYASPQIVLANYEQALARWLKLINALTAIDRCRIIPSCRTELSGSGCRQSDFSPYILQAAFKDIPGEVMARALDDLGFAVSTGSACASYSPERPVLAAMNINENLSIEGIRISQGFAATNEEIDLLLNAITEVLKFL
ncbi:MAG: cysteine desulfurase [Treponema sp.]|jgi:cysteine desulfurase|nr:cysteine desulfurase [Treponema sp.]